MNKNLYESEIDEILLDENRKIFLYGAGFGPTSYSRITLAALSGMKIKVECFLDDDKGKEGKLIDGVLVKNPHELLNFDNDKVVVILSSNYIEPMIKKLESISRNDCVLRCSTILRMATPESYLDIMSYEEVEMRAVNHEEKLINKTSSEKPLINIIDIQITEKCTMKCIDCSNLMQYYDEPIHVEFSELKNSFKKLSECVEEFKEVRVLGGEPFFNKEIGDIVQYLVGFNNVNRISIATNATIIPNHSILEKINHEKVFLDITDYDEFSKNHAKLISVLKNAGIKYIKHKINTNIFPEKLFN